MLSLYLLRHGETEFSRQDRFCGRIDAPLTERGRRMALRFAESYDRIPWCAILTSTRTRTVETALPLADRAALSIRRDPRLDELHFGRWQGLSKYEVAASDADRYAAWCRDPVQGPPDGESPAAAGTRAAAVVGELRAQHRDGNVLVVSHKTVLRLMVCGLLGLDLGRYRQIGDWPVGAVSLLELGSGGAALRRLADDEHLVAEASGASEEQPVSDGEPTIAA